MLDVWSVMTLASALTRVLQIRRMVQEPHCISAGVSSGGGNARQEEPLFVKLKPRDTEAPSVGAIRASLDSSASIPRFPLSEKRLHAKILRRLLSCLALLASPKICFCFCNGHRFLLFQEGEEKQVLSC